MKPLKIYLCEDEKLQLKINHLIVNEFLEEKHLQAEFISRSRYEEQDDELLKSVEIAILDIDLGETNGIQLAERMRQLNPNVVVIFITAYERFSLEASKIYLSGFLHKPLEPFALKNTLDRAIVQVYGYRAIAKNTRKVLLKNGNLILPERTIISLEKIPNSKDIKVLTTKETYEFRDTLKHAEKLLSDSFITLSRSVMVNCCYIARIEYGTVTLRNGTTYHIAINRVKDIQRRYANFLSEQ